MPRKHRRHKIESWRREVAPAQDESDVGFDCRPVELGEKRFELGLADGEDFSIERLVFENAFHECSIESREVECSCADLDVCIVGERLRRRSRTNRGGYQVALVESAQKLVSQIDAELVEPDFVLVRKVIVDRVAIDVELVDERCDADFAQGIVSHHIGECVDDFLLGIRCRHVQSPFVLPKVYQEKCAETAVALMNRWTVRQFAYFQPWYVSR